MKRRPQHSTTVGMFTGYAQPQLPGLSEWRDLAAGQQPDPVAEEQARRAALPLKGQIALAADDTGDTP